MRVFQKFKRMILRSKVKNRRKKDLKLLNERRAKLIELADKGIQQQSPNLMRDTIKMIKLYNKSLFALAGFSRKNGDKQTQKECYYLIQQGVKVIEQLYDEIQKIEN